jgi:NAD(P)-dependent dehydrogenase (short-subunit alcohol dehydrogenase family)
MELNGTSAVVSGGASGLGEATARVLAAAGVTVVIADLNESRGKQIADEIGGQFARTDVTDEASVQAAVDLAVATGEPLRTGVSCAGIGWAARTVGRDGTPHDLGAYQKVIAVNLIGTFNVMRIAAAAMAKTEPADADGQRGVIINTSSVAGIEGQTGQIAYSASKGGIIGMTVPGARDLAAIGVRVNTICPGIIDTPIYGFREGAEEFKARLVAPVVFPKRMGRADEFGHLVRSLIENDYINAEVVRFDGGIRFQPKLCQGASRPLGLSPGTRRWPPSEDCPRIGGTWLGDRPRAAGWRSQGGCHQDGPADEGEHRDRLDRQRFGDE